MTLQEKIKKKAEGYGKLAPVFLEGTKFALESQWISVNEDLPCNHEELIKNSANICDRETECVIVCDDKQNIDFDYMVYYNGKWEWLRNEYNTHWFSIPKLPKE